MERDILIESDHGRRLLAVVEDGRLREIRVEREETGKTQGQIFLGRVENVLPGMQAAFVDIGLKKNAFLSEDDVPVDRADALAARERVKPVCRGLKRGQEIIVQVTKEPGGDKGPRVSGHVSLPGRYLVLLPTVEYTGVSRKIEDDAERARLRAAAGGCRREGMGLIVRTAAQGADEAQLKKDADALVRLWDGLRAKAGCRQAPCLLYRDENIARRAVRDMLDDGVRSVLLDDEALWREAREAAEEFCPELSERVKLYEGEVPLLDAWNVRGQIAGALERRVWLKSGAFLVIDHTEALTVIDVNTGKYVGESSLSDTVFRINCEAAEEIARQLRLRDIGGIIVIDFIDMEDRAQKEELVSRLRAALRNDSSKTRVAGITELGLVEMTRKRADQSLRAALARPCPVCQGAGELLSEDAEAHDALLSLRACAAREKAEAYLVEAPRAVADRIAALGGVAGLQAWVRVGAGVRVTPRLAREIPKDARKLVNP